MPFEKAFRRYLTPDLLILDDFGLRRLNAQQSTDLYELIIARHATVVSPSPRTAAWTSG
jgi:DNA replication protein DnaC